jgi:beta-glucosidase
MGMVMKKTTGLVAICMAFAAPSAVQSQDQPKWMNAALSADTRAALLEKELTPDERLNLLHGIYAMPFRGPKPADALGSAGFVPGVARLDIPALQEADAGLGVTNPSDIRRGERSTPLPSGLAIASTFDPSNAFAGGTMIGLEAWQQGFNVLLAGGVNLERDPRNGRNFEYLGEDPLLAGLLDGSIIRGIQDQHVLSTVKHFALNDQETNRNWANSIIGEAEMRESDLLAFEIAIEQGNPGSVMCSYNLINDHYACGNRHLLNDILKGDWKFPGWVMSDWGAVHDPLYALEGLDQESGSQFDGKVMFGEPLQNYVTANVVSSSRVSEMVRRILRSMFAVGLFDHPPVKTPVDFEKDASIARQIAQRGIVLLKNNNSILPLSLITRRIAVIGGHADAGVLSGAGSSQVLPAGGKYQFIPVGGEGPLASDRNIIIDPSSPLKAIRDRAPGAEVRFDDGRYVSSAVQLAKWADVVIIFGNQWMIEGYDSPDLSLPDGQDDVIAAVTAANPKSVVILQTGGPVLMPWLDHASAVLEAWYSGARGGDAIADILFGAVNPSGHLPITFPLDEHQNPRPELPGSQLPAGTIFNVNYPEGSDVGYRWYQKQNLQPLFPFGFGLSYTDFKYSNLRVTGSRSLRVTFDISNVGKVAGEAVPQVYLTATPAGTLKRIVGFKRTSLEPGQSAHLQINADTRLLSHFDTKMHAWLLDPGSYQVMIGSSAMDQSLLGSVILTKASLKP